MDFDRILYINRSVQLFNLYTCKIGFHITYTGTNKMQNGVEQLLYNVKNVE